MREALGYADAWRKLNTSWTLLDCELMPWSAKARELLKTQYAVVGSRRIGLPARGGGRPGTGRRAADWE